MQQFYKKFFKQTFFFTIQTKIVFSEIKDLSKVGLILLYACMYRYIGWFLTGLCLFMNIGNYYLLGAIHKGVF